VGWDPRPAPGHGQGWGSVIHLRLIVASDLAAPVLDYLHSRSGVAHVLRVPNAAIEPAGDLVLCDVAREGANEVVEWLQRLGVHHSGAISVDTGVVVVSDAAEVADAQAPGEGGDALIWEQLEAQARSDSVPTTSFFVLMSIASVIATVGILLDSPILIVGAMVVGPEYGPIAAVCVAATRRRWRSAAHATATLGSGLLAAAVASLLATLLFKTTGLAVDQYDLSDRELTAFISHPDGLGAVVAVLAGIVGMLSLTQSRSGALVGVLVSVTTIPAVANVGVAAAYREWSEVGGALLQLAINVAALTVAGVATLLVQHRATSTIPGPSRWLR
jgi:uncharacterized hydrophobic protein (TIGR00271 family)